MTDLRHPETLTIYGADWCGDCRRAKKVLTDRGVDHIEIDLVADPAKAEDAEAISGRKNIPVVVFPDGAVLVEPSNAELAGKLDELGL